MSKNKLFGKYKTSQRNRLLEELEATQQNMLTAATLAEDHRFDAQKHAQQAKTEQARYDVLQAREGRLIADLAALPLDQEPRAGLLQRVWDYLWHPRWQGVLPDVPRGTIEFKTANVDQALANANNEFERRRRVRGI